MYSNFRAQRINKSLLFPREKAHSSGWRKGEGGERERNGSMRFVRLPIDAFHAVPRNVANSNQANGN